MDINYGNKGMGREWEGNGKGMEGNPKKKKTRSWKFPKVTREWEGNGRESRKTSERFKTRKNVRDAEPTGGGRKGVGPTHLKLDDVDRVLLGARFGRLGGSSRFGRLGLRLGLCGRLRRPLCPKAHGVHFGLP